MHKRTEQELQFLVEDLRSLAIVVTPADAPAVVASDADDDKLFACALAGNAEIAVTGDAQVLAVRRYRDIQVISPAGLLALLEGA